MPALERCVGAKSLLQDFYANNGSFLIKAGTSNSHAADPVLLRLVQFYNGNFILHAALNQLRQFHFMNVINGAISAFCCS